MRKLSTIMCYILFPLFSVRLLMHLFVVPIVIYWYNIPFNFVVNATAANLAVSIIIEMLVWVLLLGRLINGYWLYGDEL